MARSADFARIGDDVLRIVASVRPGRVVTFADLGAHPDVPPRHVAYILAILDPVAAAGLPRHRAAAADGAPIVGAHRAMQRDLLAAEGVAVAALPHGVPRQARPAEAPPARRRRR